MTQPRIAGMFVTRSQAERYQRARKAIHLQLVAEVSAPIVEAPIVEAPEPRDIRTIGTFPVVGFIAALTLTVAVIAGVVA